MCVGRRAEHQTALGALITVAQQLGGCSSPHPHIHAAPPRTCSFIRQFEERPAGLVVDDGGARSEADSAAVQDFLAQSEQAFRQHPVWRGCQPEVLDQAVEVGAAAPLVGVGSGQGGLRNAGGGRPGRPGARQHPLDPTPGGLRALPPTRPH